MRIDTRSALARAQYDANVQFVREYTPLCARPRPDGVKRVLISGYGRFLSIRDNATGRIVSALGGLTYPETDPPERDRIDPIGPQLAVGLHEAEWPLSGKVEICAMVLPVVWDVAPLLLLRELEAFAPDLVLMNGVAGARQALWIELGGVNDAAPLQDGSGILTPDDSGEERVPILADAPATHPNLMSWDVVRSAAARALEAEADPDLADVLTGVALAGYPRSSNTYLCNNITFVTSFLMDSPKRPEALLSASEPLAGRPNEVLVSLSDYHHVPRAFLHWPSELTAHERAAAGARILTALADAQLATSSAPVRGDNAFAADDLRGGDTF